MVSDLECLRARYDDAYRLGSPTPTAREMVAGGYVEALEVEVERLNARLTEEVRLRNHWRGKAEQLTAALAGEGGEA